MKKLLSWCSAVGLALGAALLVPAGAATAQVCDTDWGTGPKTRPGGITPPDIPYVVNVRAGQDVCWDRMVVDIRGEVAGYNVRYVDQFSGIGSGLPIPLRGDGDLAVVFNAPAYREVGGGIGVTYFPHNRNEVWDVSAFRTFRQIAWDASFEGQTSVGLGVREELPFRVFVLDGPEDYTRLVVDVAHTA